MPPNAVVSAVSMRSTSVNSIQHPISAPYREKHIWTIPYRVREGVRFAAVEGEIIRMIGGNINGNSTARRTEQESRYESLWDRLWFSAMHQYLPLTLIVGYIGISRRLLSAFGSLSCWAIG